MQETLEPQQPDGAQIRRAAVPAESARSWAQSAAGAVVLTTALTIALMYNGPGHSTQIDRANLELAAAKAAHEDSWNRWHAALDVASAANGQQRQDIDVVATTSHSSFSAAQRERKAQLETRHGQDVLAAAHAQLYASRQLAYAERFSQGHVALEQLRTLLQPPATHPDAPLQWPVEGAVVSGYGLRAWPDFGRLHPGIDIVNLPGTPIRAAADGVVVSVRRDPSQGNAVVIDHGDNEQHPGRWTTVYGHLDDITVMERQRVRAGDGIGTLGNTGRQTTGPHLHFEVRIENQPVDPRRWLP